MTEVLQILDEIRPQHAAQVRKIVKNKNQGRKMTDEKHDKTFDALLLDWLKGDQNAYRLAQGLLYVAHLWDDLIDKDKPRTDNEINDALRFCLSDMPLNPFYQAYAPQLAPQISSVAIQYQIANILEHGTDGEKYTAFAMRNALLHVVAYIIYLIGGADWHNTAGLEFYQYISQNMDSLFAEYMKEMSHA